MKFIPDELFITKTNIIYPPFKKGLYMEEYFLNHMATTNKTTDKEGRLFIPALWTNFQIESWFPQRKDAMQRTLDKWISENHCPSGYFVVVQHDDGPMLQLPPGTKIYGACSGQVYLPLIYQDTDNKLENLAQNKKAFKNRPIFCSFVGSVTHNVRKNIIDIYKNNPKFMITFRQGWTNRVQSTHQDQFTEITLKSKFALAPRGYGRSSFRFFEILQLGTVPVYVWDDIEWLPYKNVLDYDTFSVSIHETELDILEEILMNITEKKYNAMLAEYQKIKHMFGLDYMCEFICGNETSNSTKSHNESTVGVGHGTIPFIPTEQSMSGLDDNTIIIDFSEKPLLSSPNMEKNADKSLEKQSDVLLVAIAIGEQYLQHYNKTFRRSHEQYAKNHGYDFKVITDFIDTTNMHYRQSKMSVFYQKMLISDAAYEYVIFIDSDVLINLDAPAIHLSENFQDKIGIIDEYSQPTREMRLKIQRLMGWEECATDYYKLCGLDLGTNKVLNSGVLVIQPKKHKEFLENVYHTYLPKSINHGRGPHFEQTSLGYELQKQNKYKLLNNKWNAIWGLHKFVGADLHEFFKQNYFIHFAGGTDIEMAPMLDRLNKY